MSMRAQHVRLRTRGMAWHVEPALRRYPMVSYFVLANGFSWLMLLLFAAWLALPAQLVVLLFTLGPTLAAVAVTAVIEGRPGLQDLWRRIHLWRVPLKWYAVALL